jgi:predicted nucleotidyltransferase
MLLKEVRRILTLHKRDLFQYGVQSLAVFGSIARGEGSVHSDIDLLVDFDSKKGLFGFVLLKGFLEKILHRDVDLVTKNALHPALREKILLEARHVL